MDLFRTTDPDFGEDYSDDGMSPESSEDEIDIILHGTPEQKRKLYKKTKDNSSSEDDFEKEMNEELQEAMDAIESKRLSSSQSDLTVSESQNKSTEDASMNDTSEIQQFYDDIYFDSDEEDQNDSENPTKKVKSKNPVISNDDLLYDPDMDDEDQRWVDKQRENVQPKTSNSKKKKNQLRTDAILNCPACMTTLCRDCQRHDTYANQYRAMFVTNCDVNKSETLNYPKEQENRKRKWKKKPAEPTSSSTSAENSELFHPVKCTECETVVAVVDQEEEIFYFFNVLASYS